MSKVTTIICDLCGEKCDHQRFGVVSGCVMKMDKKGQFGPMIFEAHYCEDDTSKILKFIEELSKKNA